MKKKTITKLDRVNIKTEQFHEQTFIQFRYFTEKSQMKIFSVTGKFAG